MTVRELIAKLEKVDPNAEAYYVESAQGGEIFLCQADLFISRVEGAQKKAPFEVYDAPGSVSVPFEDGHEPRSFPIVVFW